MKCQELTRIVYSSELAAKALLIENEGIKYSGGMCKCAMCQRPIHDGDLVLDSDTLSRTFTDFPHLLATSNERLYICGYCNATRQQARNRYLQNSIITEAGIYNMSTDAARSWFWLTPPEPPYTVVFNHGAPGCFHYHWRTPVTLDNRLVSMNWDGVIHRVQRFKVIDAIAHAAVLVSAANFERKKNLVKGVFDQINRKGMMEKYSDHGRINATILATVRDNPELRSSLEFLQRLSPGELLAASAFLKAVPALPVMPPLVRGMPKKTVLEDAEA